MARLDGTKLGTAMVMALTAACPSPRATTGAAGGHGGDPGAAGHGGTTGTTTTTTTTTAITTGVGGFGGFGGMGGAGGAVADSCNPPPDATTLWGQKALSYPSYGEVTLCPYVHDVLLVVNTAAI